MPPPDPPTDPEHHRGTVLVVDDEPLVRKVVRRELEDRGFKVYSVPSALLAFQVLLETHVDCIVADQRMPVGGTGEFLLDYVANEWRQCGRVLHTGFPDDLESLFEHTVVGKPATGDELAEAVENEIKLRRRAPSSHTSE